MKIEIKTTGTSKIAPNRIVFSFSFITNNKEYDKVIEEGANKTIKFHSILEKLDIDNDQLKTISYRIREIKLPVKYNTSNEDTRSNRFDTKTKYEFDHYELNQICNLEIPYNKEKLFDVIKAMLTLDNCSSFTFAFTIDKETRASLENQSLFNAIDIANEKAQKLFEHMNTTGTFNTIRSLEATIVESFTDYINDRRYAKSDIDLKRCCAAISSESLSQSITPEDVQVDVNVINVFEIS